MDDAPAALTPRPRRVLMTADTVGGVWQYALDLAHELASAGVEIVLVTMGAPISRDQRAALHRFGYDITVHESAFRLEWMEDPWADVAAAGEWLLDLERAHQPDVIHLNGYTHAALPWRAPVLVVAHSCVCSWWRAVHGVDAPANWATYRAAVARGLRAADLVVAPTRAMAAQLTALHGSVASCRVIPNGRAPLRSSYPPREYAILGVGRLWDAAKNVAALAAVAPELPWPVRLAGDTRSPDGAVVDLPGVELLGVLPAPALGEHFARAAIYALPARYEPFGLSVLEAAQAGCALVLGDIRSLRENWDGAALFVPPDDHAALREALLEFIRRPELRRRLGDEARRRSAAFTPARMGAAYLDAYAHLLRAPAPARRRPDPKPQPVLA